MEQQPDDIGAGELLLIARARPGAVRDRPGAGEGARGDLGSTFFVNSGRHAGELKMQKRFALLFVLVGVLAVASRAAWAMQDYYVDPSQVDLIHILAPPPSADSDEGKADLQAVLATQHTRTEAQVKEAEADSEKSVFRFADVMGPGFKPENLPFATTFFERVSSDGEKLVSVAKAYFNRPRPFVMDHRVKPVVGRPLGPGYPGGHATFAYVNAILLAYMVPEKAVSIFSRAGRFARNRVIGGVHYPTDTEAGRISASVIDNVLLHESNFLADFARARAEVRNAIGLHQERDARDSQPPESSAWRVSQQKVR
jgi:acid phosphatase (class A)